MVEQRSPKPRVESSSLSAPAKNATQTGGVFISGRGRKARNERPSRRPQRGLETGSSVPVAHCVRERRAGPSALAGEGLPKTPPKRVAFLFQAGAERRETNARLAGLSGASRRGAVCRWHTASVRGEPVRLHLRAKACQKRHPNGWRFYFRQGQKGLLRLCFCPYLIDCVDKICAGIKLQLCRNSAILPRVCPK